MRFPVRAITLDLDDTVWPITPVILRAERILADWLVAHAPRTATRWPLERMCELRHAVEQAHPHLAHDFTRQRMIALERMLDEAGDDVALAQPAFDAFFAARCEVEHYEDSLEALDRLAARVPLAAAVDHQVVTIERVPHDGLVRRSVGVERRDRGDARLREERPDRRA